MLLLGKSLSLDALQPKGSLQNHKQTSAPIQRRVEAQDTDNIDSFHSILYTAKISLCITISKYRLRFNIIIPQTQHIPYPPSKNKTTYGMTHAKSPHGLPLRSPGTRSYISSPKAKQRQHPIIDAVAVSKISCLFVRRWRNAHSASDEL